MIPSIYTSDWYNRSNTDYVLTNSDLEIGFIKIPNNQYSRFLYNEDKIERLCSDKNLIKKEMRDMLKSMGLINVSFNLSTSNSTACTNGRYIEVGLGEESIDVDSAYDKMDRIIGMTIHEACHCLYTDFNYINSVISKHPSLVHHIHNVLEDELIEEKICNRFPGYSNFLSKLKYEIFEKSSEDDDEVTGELVDILEIFFYIIRYPKYICTINENTLKKYEDLFNKIKYICTDCDCFNINNEFVTRSTTSAAIRIYDLIKNYKYNKSENSSEDKSKNDNENNSENDSDSECEVEVRDKNDDIFNQQEKDLTEGEGNGIIGVLSKVLQNIWSSSEATTLKKLIVYHNNVSDSDDDLTYENHEIFGTSQKISKDVTNVSEGNSAMYNSYLKAVQSYISLAKSLIIPNCTSYELETVKFRRNGSLDPSRLVNAMCNEQTVYVQKQMKTKSNDAEYALVLMIDESGSMEGDKLNRLASEFSIMIYEALKDYKKIKIFVYGHGDKVYKYLDPFTLKSKYTLGDRKSQGGQNEAESYRIVVEDVKMYTKLPIIVFNITDSCYLARCEQIKNLLNELREDKVQPAYFNLITLGHNLNLNSKVMEWNDLIYGKGNWILYPMSRITPEIKTLIKNFSSIIRKNFKS